ncbi:MAG TPA: hypothetical protein VJ826_10810 [Candidatus Polarisedimenticolaceae bacterium]|nr:hypothetical protein [Candidatus Polarisedimenticolaceae bacterium]
MIAIHEPDVALTDLGLAALGAYFSWRLATGSRSALTRSGAVVMGGLASAAFWGAVFHAFFPDKTATRAGLIAWAPVALSIVVVASALLGLGLSVLAPRIAAGVRRMLVAVYAIAFAVTAVVLDDSFTSIVRFYAPALALVLVAAAVRAVRTRSAGWGLLVTGFALSVVAAALQQAKVAIDPTYFNHNAVYHVVQGVALVFLYQGFRRAG